MSWGFHPASEQLVMCTFSVPVPATGSVQDCNAVQPGSYCDNYFQQAPGAFAAPAAPPTSSQAVMYNPHQCFNPPQPSAAFDGQAGSFPPFVGANVVPAVQPFTAAAAANQCFQAAAQAAAAAAGTHGNACVPAVVAAQAMAPGMWCVFVTDGTAPNGGNMQPVSPAAAPINTQMQGTVRGGMSLSLASHLTLPTTTPEREKPPVTPRTSPTFYTPQSPERTSMAEDVVETPPPRQRSDSEEMITTPSPVHLSSPRRHASADLPPFPFAYSTASERSKGHSSNVSLEAKDVQHEFKVHQVFSEQDAFGTPVKQTAPLRSEPMEFSTPVKGTAPAKFRFSQPTDPGTPAKDAAVASYSEQRDFSTPVKGCAANFRLPVQGDRKEDANDTSRIKDHSAGAVAAANVMQSGTSCQGVSRWPPASKAASAVAEFPSKSEEDKAKPGDTKPQADCKPLAAGPLPIGRLSPGHVTSLGAASSGEQRRKQPQGPADWTFQSAWPQGAGKKTWSNDASNKQVKRATNSELSLAHRLPQSSKSRGEHRRQPQPHGVHRKAAESATQHGLACADPNCEQPVEPIVWHVIEQVLLQRPQLEAGKRVIVSFPESLAQMRNQSDQKDSCPMRATANRALRHMSRRLPGSCWTVDLDKQEMQVHLADVARFSRFCDGM
eukprot:TRINITY_DN79387_c0_g1_i1.p1 TRINITY_DN79387_c0_g1~~TRINITY_DN79387_c0_g1_i1.p1  ORF type:complete len:664 (+),score=139.71 TRINITY_DN79387_c0_g1_i1:157-2148(+)